MNRHFASMGEERRVLLGRARADFDRTGQIPSIVAARLMQLGVIVPDLEDKWSRDIK
jgi:hypothetical protein